MYTHAHLWFPPSFLAVYHHYSKNWVPSILTHNLWLIFMEMKQKKIFFSKKKIQNGRLKKSSFFKIANSQKISAKISQMGPWVSRIEWYKGHWCSSTYMAMRLSDKSSKTAKKYRKCIFWLFLNFFFEIFFIFFASFPWKSAQIYMVEWMGQNFDVFFGFQKISCYA